MYLRQIAISMKLQMFFQVSKQRYGASGYGIWLLDSLSKCPASSILSGLKPEHLQSVKLLDWGQPWTT
jgi:hypothetical protein